MRSRVTALLVTLLAGVLTLAGTPAHAAGSTGAGGGETAYAERASGRSVPTLARGGCSNRQVEVLGRGFGHGVGMSQHGAWARAKRGHSYQRILGFYYPNTRFRNAGGRIRVLLTGDRGRDVVVDARSRLRLRRLSDGRAWSLGRLRPRATRWRIVANTAGDRVVQFTRPGIGWRKVRAFSANVEVHAGGRPVRLVTPSGGVPYRGSLALFSGDTVNTIRVEAYLRGVVPREMPALWHGQALRAQAVAARTYAVRERLDAPSSRHFDVYDDTRSQVYYGSSVEHPNTDTAIRDTVWQIRVHDGKPAFTQFSASNGGWSVGNPSFAYLRARQDDPDREIYPAWSVCVAKSAISRAYGVGTFQGVRVTERDGNGDWGGRALTVRVQGSTRTVLVDGTDFRFTLGLRSNWFVFG